MLIGKDVQFTNLIFVGIFLRKNESRYRLKIAICVMTSFPFAG